MTITIRGERICRWCKIFCREASWRTKRGQRRQYWCSEDCLEINRRPNGMPQSAWGEYRDVSFEQVDVVEGQPGG